MQSHAPLKSGPATVIRRIEGERDDVKMEVHKVKIECQSLKRRLKSLQDGHQHDLGGLEDSIAELKLQLDEVSRERE